MNKAEIQKLRKPLTRHFTPVEVKIFTTGEVTAVYRKVVGSYGMKEDSVTASPGITLDLPPDLQRKHLVLRGVRVGHSIDPCSALVYFVLRGQVQSITITPAIVDHKLRLATKVLLDRGVLQWDDLPEGLSLFPPLNRAECLHGGPCLCQEPLWYGDEDG